MSDLDFAINLAFTLFGFVHNQYSWKHTDITITDQPFYTHLGKVASEKGRSNRWIICIWWNVENLRPLCDLIIMIGKAASTRVLFIAILYFKQHNNYCLTDTLELMLIERTGQVSTITLRPQCSITCRPAAPGSCGLLMIIDWRDMERHSGIKLNKNRVINCPQS